MARTNKYTERRRKGIVTPYGQWLYPGKVTTIPGNNITMQGVPYPVLGVSDKGDTKMMMPGMDYLFKGNEVTEYPVMQKGGFGKRRVEKNGMEYLKDTDGYTGVVQKQTQHGLGLSRRYDAPVYQYYGNGKPVGETWNGAGKFQEEIAKDYESEPTIPYNRKFSSYDPNSLTYFKDLAIGETPFKPYVSPETQTLLDYRLPITENPLQTRMGYSVPIYTPSVSQPTYMDNENKPSNYLEIIDNPTGGKYEQFVQYFYPRLNNYLLENYPQYYNRDLVKWMTAQTAGESGYDVNPSQYNRWGLQKNKQNISYNSLNDAISAYFSSLEHNFPNAFTAKNVDEYEKALYHNGKRYHESGDYGLKNYKTLYNTIDQLYPSMQTGGKIHIKEKNRGKFTEAAQRAGKSVQAYAAQILANKENYSPTLVKRAVFARNASKFKHQEGGEKPSFEKYYQSLPAYKNDTTNYDLRTAYQYLPYEEMKQFATMPNKHLSSVVELPDGSYRFLKSKNHPSLQQEIDWYNSDEAKEFRNNYTLDTSGEYYRYVPKKHQIGKYLEGNYLQPKTVDSVMGAWNDMLAKGFAKGDMIANHVGNALNAAATASAAAATHFGKNFTKDIMAGQGNEQTSVAAPLYLPAQQNNPQQTENWMAKFKVIDDGAQPAKIYDRFRILNPDYIKNPEENPEYIEQFIPTDIIGPKPPISKEPSLPGFKLATGGPFSTPAEIERGEIVSTPTGDSIANGLMDYHELFSNRNEKGKNIVNLTNDMGKDVQRNPQLTSINERVNKYTAMRRNGKTFIFPSTVGRNGEILEPKNGNFYWLAKTINKK